jgi:hypothetical protein
MRYYGPNFEFHKTMSFALKASAVGVLAISSQYATAQSAQFASKDWQFSDYSSAQQPNGACVASTVVKQDKTYYKLEFTHLKNSNSPTEVFVHQIGPGKGPIAGWGIGVVGTSFVTSYGLQNQDQASGSIYYWGFPVSTQTLINAFIQGQTVSASSVGHAKNKKIKFSFSNNGAAEVFQALQRQCGDGTTIDNATFESTFLVDITRGINPQTIDAARSQQMRDVFFKGGQNFFAQMRNSDAQAALESKWSPQITERSALRDSVARLTQTEIPNLKGQYSDNEANRAQLQSNLDSVNAKIPGLASASKNADAVLAKAQQAIAPYIDRHNTLVNGLAEARDRLSRNQTRRAQIDSTTQTLANEISNLAAERDNDQAQAQSASSQLPQAQQDLSNAQYAYNTYDVHGQIEIRIRNNDRLRWLEREAQESRDEARRAERDVEDARRDSDRANESVSQCRATPVTPCPPVPAPGPGPHPGPHHDQLQLSCGQAPNCSQQEADADRALNRLRESKERAERARNRAFQAENESRQIRESIEAQVRAEYAQLQTDVNTTAQRVQSLQLSYDNNSARVRQINDVEIPNRQNQIAQLQNEGVSVDSAIASASNDVDSRSSALKSFNSQVGWDQKKSTLDSAQADDDAKNGQLNDARAQKASFERDITTSFALKAQLEQTIAQKNDEVARSNSRIAALTQLLTAYDSAKADLLATADALKTEFAALKSKYAALIP